MDYKAFLSNLVLHPKLLTGRSYRAEISAILLLLSLPSAMAVVVERVRETERSRLPARSTQTATTSWDSTTEYSASRTDTCTPVRGGGGEGRRGEGVRLLYIRNVTVTLKCDSKRCIHNCNSAHARVRNKTTIDQKRKVRIASL